MKTKHLLQTIGWALVSAFILQPSALLSAASLGTAFTYQGRLMVGVNPANGNYDFKLTLYDDASDGSAVAVPLTNAAVAVSDGLFTVVLDFGSAYDGNARWLQLGVRSNGVAVDFATLSPRQSLTASPYALYAPSAGAAMTAATAVSANAVAAANVTGTLALGQLPGAVVTNNATGVTLAGTFSGSGAGLTSVNADQVDGQHGAFYQNAANLTSGTLADARLSASVALRSTTNRFTDTNVFTKPVGIDCMNPGRPLQVGNANNFGSEGMIRLASRSTNSAENRVWDIGVPQTGTNLSGAGYSFVIDDTQLGTTPEFVVRWGNGYVGIGRTNPATALDVNGTVTATGFAGNASGLTNLNATQLVGGTLADARLSANVALLNANQVFSGSNRFGGVATLTNAANTFAGVFSGNGAGLTNLSASKLASGVVPLSLLPGAVVTNNETGLNLSGTFSGNGAGVTNINLLTVNSQGAIAWTTNWGNFSLVSSLPVGLQPFSVAAADVNGDGKLDLIAANRISDTLSVLTNNGSGGFAPASTLGVGADPQSVIAADVNGDGKADLISANYVDGTLSVLTNNGSGVFGSNATLPVGVGPISVTAADVNGDGKLDLISANNAFGTLSVLTNNGSGVFGSNATLTVGIGSHCVAAADVNGDGKLDLISANAGAYSLSVLTNNGSGVFGSNATLTVGSNPFSVVAVDVNGNGKVDLISANNGANTLTVLTNNGSGVFGPNATLTVGSYPASVVAADVNGDGKLDLISTTQTGNTLTVLTNNGNGSFVLAASPGAGTQPYSVVAADVNGDGGPDLISANTGDSTLSVLFNFPSSFSAGFRGDFTGDGSGLTSLNASQITSGIFTGNGGGLTNLDAADLTGTVADARLSANVALRNAANTFTATNIFTKRVGIDVTTPGQLLQVGNTTTLGSQGMIRFASRSSVNSNNRIWDIGVPETGSDTAGPGYCFVIDDTQLGTAPEFLVHWGNGYVGIGRTNPATALDVNGTVTATNFSGNAAGLFNQVCSANYVFSYSTTTQAVAVANTFQNITNNTDAQINGWTHAANTASFTNNQSGLYLIQYNAEATTATTASSTISLRVVVNEVEIAGSQAAANANTANLVVSISKSFVASVSSGGVLKFQFTGSSTNDRLVSNSGTGTTRPSFSCTIMRLQ